MLTAYFDATPTWSFDDTYSLKPCPDPSGPVR